MPDINVNTFVNPLYHDSIGDANNPLPHITFKRTPNKQPTPLDIEEDQTNATSELVQHLQDLKKTSKQLSLFEARYRESSSSYADEKVAVSEGKFAVSSSTDKAEEESWGRKLLNTVSNFWNSLFSKSTPPATTEEIAEETPAVQPLPGRPLLAASPAEIKQIQLDKLIEAMALALQQIDNAAREAEEIIMRGPADVALERGLKALIDKETLSSKDLTHRIIELQNITSDQLKQLREQLMDVRQRLDRNVDVSNTLGWINMGTTAVVLLSGAAIFLTGGGSAVLSSISLFGGAADGVGTIYKSSVDTNVNKQKGEIQYIATSKHLLNTKVDTNLNDMELFSKAIHSNNEKLIELAAIKRDACRQFLQQ
ncbi:MAG: hypothetical protein WC222_06020 [Parachlamydiales bacterium]|jgi:hypothetical protein